MGKQFKSEARKQAPMIPSYLLLLAWLLFLCFAIGWIFIASFSTTRDIFCNTIFKHGLHPQNYVTAWIGNNVWKYFVNSIIYANVCTFGVLLISSPASYVIGRMKFMGRQLIVSMFIVALSIPVVMTIIPQFSLATKLHLTGHMITLIAIYISGSIPFNVYFLATFFASLPGELEDAALIDGCSYSRAFWNIMLPLAQPALITVGIFNFMDFWNEYFRALIFANTDALRPLGVGLQSMITSMKYSGDWGGLFAAVVIVFLPTLILYVLLSEKIIAGITGGALKG